MTDLEKIQRFVEKNSVPYLGELRKINLISFCSALREFLEEDRRRICDKFDRTLDAIESNRFESFVLDNYKGVMKEIAELIALINDGIGDKDA